MPILRAAPLPLLLSLAVTCCACGLRGQEVDAKSWLRKDGTGRLQIGDADLQRLVDTMVPVIEEECGRVFVRPPEVRLSSANEIARSLELDLAPTLRHLYRDADPRWMERQIKYRAQIMSGIFMGKYGMHDDVLYVVPERVEQFLKFLAIDEEVADELFQLVMAHELIHALQDQIVGLDRLIASTRDQDAVHTFNALVEGHAVHYSEKVARRLGFVAGIEPFHRLTSTPPPGLYLITRFGRSLGETYYTRGAALMAALETAPADGEAAADRVWRTLGTPDRPSAVVFAPDRIDDAVSVAGDPEPLRQAVVDWLGRGRWLMGRGTAGEALLRSVLRGVAADELDEILADLRVGVFVEAEGPVPALRVLVLKLRFASADAARAHVDVSRRLVADEVGAPWTAFAALAGDGGDEDPDGSVVDVEASPGPKGRILWARRGDTVVEVSILGLRRDDGELAALIEAMFAAPIARD